MLYKSYSIGNSSIRETQFIQEQKYPTGDHFSNGMVAYIKLTFPQITIKGLDKIEKKKNNYLKAIDSDQKQSDAGKVSICKREMCCVRFIFTRHFPLGHSVVSAAQANYNSGRKTQSDRTQTAEDNFQSCQGGYKFRGKYLERRECISI